MSTLLQQAKKIEGKRGSQRDKINLLGDEELELVIAYVKEEITTKQFMHSLNFKYGTTYEDSSARGVTFSILMNCIKNGKAKIIKFAK